MAAHRRVVRVGAAPRAAASVALVVLAFAVAVAWAGNAADKAPTEEPPAAAKPRREVVDASAAAVVAAAVGAAESEGQECAILNNQCESCIGFTRDYYGKGNSLRAGGAEPDSPVPRDCMYVAAAGGNRCVPYRADVGPLAGEWSPAAMQSTPYQGSVLRLADDRTDSAAFPYLSNPGGLCKLFSSAIPEGGYACGAGDWKRNDDPAREADLWFRCAPREQQWMGEDGSTNPQGARGAAAPVGAGADEEEDDGSGSFRDAGGDFPVTVLTVGPDVQFYHGSGEAARPIEEVFTRPGPTWLSTLAVASAYARGGGGGAGSVYQYAPARALRLAELMNLGTARFFKSLLCSLAEDDMDKFPHPHTPSLASGGADGAGVCNTFVKWLIAAVDMEPAFGGEMGNIVPEKELDRFAAEHGGAWPGPARPLGAPPGMKRVSDLAVDKDLFGALCYLFKRDNIPLDGYASGTARRILPAKDGSFTTQIRLSSELMVCDAQAMLAPVGVVQPLAPVEPVAKKGDFLQVPRGGKVDPWRAAQMARLNGRMGGPRGMAGGPGRVGP